MAGCIHCVTAYSMQSYADSAYEEYTDAYHWSVHMQTSAYGHFNDMRLYILHKQSLRDTVYYILSRSGWNGDDIHPDSYED